MRTVSRIRAVLAWVAGLTVVSCSGEGTDASPAIALSITPSEGSVVQGGSLGASASVTRSGGYVGTITFVVDGLPEGVAATASNFVNMGATTTATVTVSAEPTAQPGTYSVTVRATGDGVSPAAAPFTLAVTVRGTFTLVVAPAGVELVQSGSGIADVSIVRTGGFIGTVTLRLTGAPAGLTAGVTPATTAGNSAVVTLTALAALAPGDYTLQLIGSTPGLTDQTIPIPVSVRSSATYSLLVQPATLSFVQGSGATTTVFIQRDGFAGAVALSAEKLPPGVTATFQPVNTTENSATLALQGSLATTPGEYEVVVRGVTPHLADQTATVRVAVVKTQAPNVSVDLTRCDGTVNVPIWFAVQDGDGPWRQVMGDGLVYRFRVEAPKVAYAFTISGFGATVVTVSFTTTTELLDDPPVWCQSASLGSKTVSGTVVGAIESDRTLIALGASRTSSLSLPFGSFLLEYVGAGPQDLLAFRTRLSDGPGPSRGVLRRGLNPPDGGTLSPIDFLGQDSFEPPSARITVAGVEPGEFTAHDLTLRTGPGCGGIRLPASYPDGSDLIVAGLPDNLLQNRDLHEFYFIGETKAGPNAIPTALRTVQQQFRSMTPQFVRLPTYLPSPAITTLEGPYKRFQVSLALPGEYDQFWTFSYTDPVNRREVTMKASRGWQQPPNVTLTTPDFVAATGWMSSWAPNPASSGTWLLEAGARLIDGTSSQAIPVVCPEPTNILFSTRSGEYR